MLGTVLIVDDHESIRRTLGSRFQAAGFTCHEAVDGMDAIEKAQQVTPHLIVLDLAMPEMNGIEAAIALKYILPTVPLFLLTAHGSREVELASYQAGISAVFSKYADLDILVERAGAEIARLARGAAYPDVT